MLTIAAEIVARADASFLNFGLQQDIAGTLNKFGSEEQKEKFLPQLCSGGVRLLDDSDGTGCRK